MNIERKAGKTKLVYDKERRTIVAVPVTPMSNPEVSEELKAELVKIGLQALKTLNTTPTQIPGWQYTEETQMRSIIEVIAPRLKAEGLQKGWELVQSQDWLNIRVKDDLKPLFKEAIDSLSQQAKEKQS